VTVQVKHSASYETLRLSVFITLECVNHNIHILAVQTVLVQYSICMPVKTQNRNSEVETKMKW